MSSQLNSLIKQFKYYQNLGAKTIDKIPEEKLFWQPNESSNSIAIIVNHLNGNMISRWTDFLNSDGEKTWRKRDEEFANIIKTKSELLVKWNEGWACIFETLELLTESDLGKEVFIRNMGHSVSDAINRQLAHYSYHIGQIVYLGKMIKNEDWDSLSIPIGNSEEYNKEKFSKPPRTEHFTDDL